MEAERKLSVEAEVVFREGAGLVLSRWSALQLAVDNEWGGRDSRRKSEQLAADVFSWFTQSTEVLYIDDLEEILNEAMLSLNTMTEDGSIEESVESLREANHRRASVPHVRQVNDDDDDDDDEDNNDERDGTLEKDDMMVDTPESQSNLNPVNTSDNNPTPKLAAKSEDGWEVVGTRRNRGKRN